jgi:hypothetical protein
MIMVLRGLIEGEVKTEVLRLQVCAGEKTCTSGLVSILVGMGKWKERDTIAL